jgi:putative FmdB family regulatory protein
MPTYTYRCQKCGHEFERFQSMSDEPVKRCEKCRSKVQRVFHPVGIAFKGPGFYKTDHRSSGKKSTSETSGSSDSGSETKQSETKSSDKSPSDKKGSGSGSSTSSSSPSGGTTSSDG